MTDRPIIFSAPMVRALLDGRKSQTRRLLKLAGRRPDYIGPKGCTGDPACWGWDNGDGGYILADRDPSDKFAASWRDFAASYAPGDRLWVRETWRPQMDADLWACVEYRADGARIKPRIEDEAAGGIFWERCNAVDTDWRQIGIEPQPALWRSPANMPRWASRLTLIVTDVRIQRVQDISEADAQAEGLVAAYEGWASDRDGRHWGPTARDSFRILWSDIHGDDAWDANPWVAALTFTVHRCNIDQMPGGDHE